MANVRYCIYCHTNKVNGMKYIGRTRLNPLHRWQEEGRGYDERNSFGKAIAEYGWDNFTHEILEYGIIGSDIADKKEREYIKRLNTVYPNGYNTEDGGVHGSSNPHEPREKRPLTGWHHSEDTKRKIQEAILKTDTHPMHQRIAKSKPVDMFTKDGEYIRTYYGANEASADTGIDVSTICKVCKDKKGRYKTAGGYVWKYHIE